MHENTVTNLSWESSLLNIGTVQSNSKNGSWKSWMANILHDHDKWQTTLKLVVLRVCLIYVIYPCQSPNCGSDKTKPTLHVHVMIIMFINSLCHVFSHGHSCSCHRSADLHVFVLGCVSSGEPKSTRIWKVGMSAWPELAAKKHRSFFHPTKKGWSWKQIRTHFVKRVWMKMLVWLVSRRVNEIMVFIWFFKFLNF